MQRIVYKIPPSTVRRTHGVNPLELGVLHACACLKLIVSNDLFENNCKTRFYGKTCKYVHGYSLSELSLLMEQGFEVDFYGKYICCPRPG